MHGAIYSLPQYAFIAWCSVKAQGLLGCYAVYLRFGGPSCLHLQQNGPPKRRAPTHRFRALQHTTPRYESSSPRKPQTQTRYSSLVMSISASTNVTDCSSCLGNTADCVTNRAETPHTKLQSYWLSMIKIWNFRISPY
jgi:hypothetical protein